MTRIRQVAPLLHIINFNNLCFRVENETTLISAKNRVDLSSISEVRSYITEWPRFFGRGATLYIYVAVFRYLFCRQTTVSHSMFTMVTASKNGERVRERRGRFG